MKKAAFLLVLIGFCFGIASTARADVQYLGKVCFQLFTNGSAVDQALNLEVLSYNTATFPIHGNIVYSCFDLAHSDPISGAAVLNGTTLQMSLNTSGAGGCAGTLLSSAYSVSFDLGTLKGAFSSTATQAPSSAGQSPSLQSWSGTVTLTTCP